MFWENGTVNDSKSCELVVTESQVNKDKSICTTLGNSTNFYYSKMMMEQHTFRKDLLFPRKVIGILRKQKNKFGNGNERSRLYLK